MEHDRQLTLHFNDGSKISFDFPEQAENVTARQLKIAEFLTSKHLIVEAEGSILIFPVANIKYIAISGPMGATPARTAVALPKHMIRGARIRA